MILNNKFYHFKFQFHIIIILTIILINNKISKEAKIGVFNLNSLDELGKSGLIQPYAPGQSNYYHLSDFSRQNAPGPWGFAPMFNISNECREKLLAKNPYAKEILIYKIFRMRPSDPIKEPGNLKLGISNVYEVFFQLFYYRANGIDKYSKVDVEGVCNEKIAIFLLHTMGNETLNKNFKNVYAQSPIKAPVPQFMKWYDTFNPNSDFYNSICSGYTYNTLIDKFLKNETKLKYYDTPLDIRRKYFGGNLYLCPEFCTYSGMFSVVGFLLSTCHCKDPKMDLLSDDTYIPDTQYMQPFDFDEKKFYENKDSFFSIGVLKCFMFTFMLATQNNYGCYIILGIASVIIFSFIELLIFEKNRILSVMELIYNNNINPKNNIKKNNDSIKNILKKNNSNDTEINKLNNNKNLISSSSKSGLESNNFFTNINISKISQYQSMNNTLKENNIQKNDKKYENSENDDNNENDNHENFEQKIIKNEKEIEIFSKNNKNINNNENIYKNEKRKNSQRKIETNYEREEESEDSEKVQNENVQNNLQNKDQNTIGTEKEDEDENEENNEEEGGENANPPKMKAKMKGQKKNEIYPKKKKYIEMTSQQNISPGRTQNNLESKDIFVNEKISNIKRKSIIKNKNTQNQSQSHRLSNSKEIISQENGRIVKSRTRTKRQSKVTFKNIHLGIDEILNTHNDLPDIQKSKLYFNMDNIFTDQELNSMNFTKFLKYDKRNLFQIYLSLFNIQSPLFFLFHYYNSTPNQNYLFQIKYPSAKLIFFCMEIFVCFFFNCTVFGTKSAKYQFFGTYTFWKHLAFGIVLSPFCLIVNNILHFLIFNRIIRKIIEIKLLFYTKLLFIKSEKVKNDFNYFIKEEYISKYHRVITKIEDIHPDDFHRRIKHERAELKKIMLNFLNIYKKKIIRTFVLTCFGIIFTWYYTTALCVAFKNSQGNFLLNVLLTFIFCNLFSAGYCFLPAYIRKKAINEKSKKFFIIFQILKII